MWEAITLLLIEWFHLWKTCSRIMFLPLWTYHAILKVLFRLQGWTNPRCVIAVVTKNIVQCHPLFVGHQHEICCMSPFGGYNFDIATTSKVCAPLLYWRFPKSAEYVKYLTWMAAVRARNQEELKHVKRNPRFHLWLI